GVTPVELSGSERRPVEELPPPPLPLPPLLPPIVRLRCAITVVANVAGSAVTAPMDGGAGAAAAAAPEGLAGGVAAAIAATAAGLAGGGCWEPAWLPRAPLACT
ncbi:hypothetical protein Vretifemale_7146, partial [Volvox reticuliferus]